jgi:hypothetical protein
MSAERVLSLEERYTCCSSLGEVPGGGSSRDTSADDQDVLLAHRPTILAC